jgi:hypothetical protein
MTSKPATIADYQAAQARDMSEAELLANVTEAAERFGWLWHHTSDSRRTHGRGFPDLVLLRLAQQVGGVGECLVVELKTEIGRTSTEQNVWLHHFERADIETYVWRPTDWIDGTIIARLARGRADA